MFKKSLKLHFSWILGMASGPKIVAPGSLQNIRTGGHFFFFFFFCYFGSRSIVAYGLLDLPFCLMHSAIVSAFSFPCYSTIPLAQLASVIVEFCRSVVVLTSVLLCGCLGAGWNDNEGSIHSELHQWYLVKREMCKNEMLLGRIRVKFDNNFVSWSEMPLGCWEKKGNSCEA